MSDNPNELPINSQSDLPEINTGNSGNGDTEPLPGSGDTTGWRLIAQETSRQSWYKPANALSVEELDTRHQTPVTPELLPGGVPLREGGWYSPTNIVDLPTIAASASVALNLDTLPPATPTDLPVTEPTSEMLDVSEPPAPPIAEGTAFEPVEAPSGLESTDGFKDAPEVPLSIALESESSGLRDIERAVEESSQSIEGLTLEEAAAQQQGTGQVLAVERGLGGINDTPKVDTNPFEAIAANPQSTPLSTASATHVLGDTGEMQKKPTPQSSGFQAQEPPQVMGTGPSQPITPEPSARDIAAARFREVEQSVQILREQFKQGQITRSQLETELRRLMVLDDQGRWWTLGVDSNRWYRFDGREWMPDTPPQTGSQPVVSAAQGVRGNYIPTETNVQAPIAPAAVGAFGLVQPAQEPTKIALDDYGMPLPQRVPEDDPNATMVNIQAFTARADEPTWGDFQQPKPTPDAVAPAAGISDKTLPSAGTPGEPIAAPTVVSPVQAAQAAMGATIEAPRPADASANVPAATPPKQIGIQPDYSAAYENPLDRSNIVKYGVWVGVTGIVAGLGVTLCLLLGMVGYYMSVVSKYQDKIDNLGQQASNFQTTRIYDSQGNILAEYNDPREGARTSVPLEEISPWVIHATVATEDETYYENPGFSVFSILRAVYTNVTGEGPRSGASTITQQLVRQLILEEDFATQVSSERKITEIILAAELSRKYDKNQILELYLNEIYYGNLAYGIEAASQAYFDKPASDLNIAEAALLAGLPQAPATYSPISNREGSTGRMTEVLRLMTEANGNGCIQLENTFNGYSNGTAFPYDLSQPLCVTTEFLNADPNFAIDLATVQVKTFEQPARDLRYAHFVNWVWDQLTEMYGADTIYATGFNVYTTLDPTIQNAAQQAVTDRLAQAQGRFVINNGSVVAIDPQTGAVWAMVGSADFNNEEIDGQVNVSFTPQQPGSSIKPLVYVTTFEGIDATRQCYDPAHPYFTASTVLWDTPTVWGDPPVVYEPLNYDRTFRGPVTIRRALSNSLNVPAVKALDCVGTERFQQKAAAMGIEFPLQSPTAVGLPSALGAAEVRLFDMVAGYAAFANGGIRREPFGISRIETVNGDIIFQVDMNSLQGIPVLSPEHAYLISSILSDNQARSEEFGTGFPMEVAGYTVAVKTGTTDENRDAWTIGWTPQVIVGVWMGNTDNQPTGGETGYGVAAPVWNATISAALQGKPNVGFPQPSSIIQQQVCNDTGTTVPTNGCGPGGNYFEVFWNSQPPTEGTDSLFQVINVDPFTNRIANEFCQQYAKPQNYLMTADATAVSWINDRQDGQAWAQSRGLTLPLQTPPVEACTADQPKPIVVLNTPAPGATVSGPVQLLGQVSLPNFQKYEFQIAPAGTENFVTLAGQTYTIQEPDANSFLGGWNSVDTPDGQYVLRLVAYATNNAFLDVRVPITVFNNQVPTTAPTQ